MNWLPVTGLFLLLFLLNCPEAQGQASASVGYTIVVHERASAGEEAVNTASDLHSRPGDKETLSAEISMYMDIAGEIRATGGSRMAGAEVALPGLAQHLDQEKDSSSFLSSEKPEGLIVPETSSRNETGTYRVVMEYN